ncbi:MAG: hypothetical protein ABIY55_33490 [Kofleriaceae bacterium]
MLSLNGSSTNQGHWSSGYFDDETKQTSIAALAEICSPSNRAVSSGVVQLGFVPRYA